MKLNNHLLRGYTIVLSKGRGFDKKRRTRLSSPNPSLGGLGGARKRRAARLFARTHGRRMRCGR